MLNFPSPRKLETQFCGKEPIISTPLTFKCILSSHHKDKHGLKNYRWWTGGKSCQSHKRKPNYYYFAPIRRWTSRVLFVSFSTSCHRQLFGFKTFSRTVYFSNLSLPSVHKGLKRDLLPETWKSSADQKEYIKME